MDLKKIHRPLRKALRNAFSLIEISLVILIIGILVAGISKAIDLHRDARLSASKSLTVNTQVHRIPNLIMWMESTQERNFDRNEVVNNGLITNWYDANPNANVRGSLSITNVAFKPKYNSEGINGLPTVKFDGTDYLASTFYRINGSKLSYFVVSKRNACSINTSTLVGYRNGVIHDYNNVQSFVGFYEGPACERLNPYLSKSLSDIVPHPGNNNPYIASAVYDGTKNTAYLNGKAYPAVSIANVNLAVDNILLCARMATSSINAYCNAEIGEVIIYDRDLSDVERKDIENYLSKKWAIKLN